MFVHFFDGCIFVVASANEFIQIRLVQWFCVFEFNVVFIIVIIVITFLLLLLVFGVFISFSFAIAILLLLLLLSSSMLFVIGSRQKHNEKRNLCTHTHMHYLWELMPLTQEKKWKRKTAQREEEAKTLYKSYWKTPKTNFFFRVLGCHFRPIFKRILKLFHNYILLILTMIFRWIIRQKNSNKSILIYSFQPCWVHFCWKWKNVCEM